MIIKDMIQSFPSQLNDEDTIQNDIDIKIDLTIESCAPHAGYVCHLGYQSTNFVQKKLDEYECLYPVAIILKDFLNNRGFLDNYQGNLEILE